MTYYAVYEKQELSKQTVSRSGVEVNQKRFVIKLFAQQNKSEKNIENPNKVGEAVSFKLDRI